MPDDISDGMTNTGGMRPNRPPPTLDLDAEKKSEEHAALDRDALAADERVVPDETVTSDETFAPPPPPSSPLPPRRTAGAIIGGAVAGAVAAAAIVVGWIWNETHHGNAPPASVATVNDLTARVSAIEGKIAKPPAAAADPALVARIDALEKSTAALKSSVTTVQQKSDQLAGAVNEAKSASQAAVSTDLSPIDDRVGKLERNLAALSSEVAQRNATPADDKALRRAVAASLLDGTVRQGEPYEAPLDAAKALAVNPETLTPLNAFAATGIPNAAALCRELLTLIPKLTPPPEASSTGFGVFDRLKEDAARLVRIQRTDAVGTDKSAIAGRATNAAVRNDLAEATRELKSLDPPDRAAVQPWLDKVAAREAAFATSRQFTTDALAALGKSSSQ